ncbi:hypothetical protein EBU24_01895 [bacterium]|jgi:hypothetical protein|nr:hypothetical protein [bacterium]
MRKIIDSLLAVYPMSERIALLESMCKQYRRQNSIRINEKQMGRRVDEERPDLEILKNQN